MPAEINIAVPYLTQHGPDSTLSNSDCGPASLAMVSSFYNVKKSVGEILALCGNPTGPVNFQTLGKVAQGLGFNVSTSVNATFDQLLQLLAQGTPVIVVGGYGYLNSVQDTNFHNENGSHIMVVCGVRPDNSVYCNDPDFYGALVDQGNHHVYTFEEFTNFWRNPGAGNTPNTLFVLTPQAATPTPPADVLPAALIAKAPKGVNVRKSAVVNPDNIEGVLSQGKQVDIVSKVQGDAVNGNTVWYQVNYNGNLLFVSAAASIQLVNKPVQTQPAPKAAPAAPTPDLTSPDYLNGLVTIYKATRAILKAHNALPDDNPGFWDQLKGALGIL